MGGLARSSAALTAKPMTIMSAHGWAALDNRLMPGTIVAIEDGLLSDLVGAAHPKRGYEMKPSEATEAGGSAALGRIRCRGSGHPCRRRACASLLAMCLW